MRIPRNEGGMSAICGHCLRNQTVQYLRLQNDPFKFAKLREFEPRAVRHNIARRSNLELITPEMDILRRK